MITISGSLSLGARPPIFRVLHDIELGPLWRQNVPEVFPLNGNRTPFGRDWQLLSYAMNPKMTGQKWRSLYAYNRAFTNGTGFNGPEPKADHVNGFDLDAPEPAWDKARFCGGAGVSGTVLGPDLIVEILDGNAAPPTLEWLMARPWLYFHAVNVTADAITKFPQNDGRPVLVPLVGSGVAKYPLSKLQRWTAPELPDPYRIYQ
jgi:hypothetical protein